ncbi:MAG: hypothetical protein LBJ70_02330 [Holosporales bacterium]|jgi:methionyl-tRNA formyltransferase|nr:hypothetical protein [Holosporales bacterium]
MSAFSIFVSDSARARSYLQQLCQNGLFPCEVILTPGEWTPPAGVVSPEGVHFNVQEPVRETIARYNLPVVPCPGRDINEPEAIDAVRRTKGKFAILAGAGGQILGKEVLSQGIPFFHVHPGIVPEFRGSTTIYYSVLEVGKAGASAFFLNERIDEGALVLKREYDLIKGIDFDYVFDPEVRGLTLVEGMKKLATDERTEPQDLTVQHLPYFIIHPVLKHLALLKAGVKSA